MADPGARFPQRFPSNLRSYKLTAAFVRRVVSETPPTRETHYADLDVPRHYLRVRPPSQPGKPWPAECRVRYTLPGGRRVWLTTGNPRTMDLSALRAAARAALAIADAGGDPATERERKAAAWTVRRLWEAYRASPDFARFTPVVQTVVSGTFNRHIIPRLGNELLTTIDVPMARRLMRAVTEDTRTYRRQRKLGGPGAARKAARLLSAVLSWAVSEGELERNALRGALRIGAEGMRECVITEPAQYAALFSAMDTMMAAGKLRPAARTLFVCAALTGMRRGELRTLTWGQVDLAQRRITLTMSKGARLAKRGVKMETISLPPLATAALAQIIPDDVQPTDRVFVPRRGALITLDHDWKRVRAAAGLPPALSLHGLRHSLGTAAVLSGLSALEVRAMLRHRDVSTSARYVHLAEGITSRLQDRATAHLTSAVPGASAATAEVHKLPRRTG